MANLVNRRQTRQEVSKHDEQGPIPSSSPGAKALLNPKEATSASLQKEPHKVDLDAFKVEMDELKKTLTAEQGEEDRAHFQRIRFAVECITFVGILTMALPAWTLVAPVLLAIATTLRWAVIAHHVCHGGYDWMEDSRFNRRTFALGLWRRCVDWIDWMLPEAWNIEHNNLHHYRLSEVDDPDLVEENMKVLRAMQLPNAIKRVAVLLLAVTWKWFYYAPNTYKHLLNQRMRGQDNQHARRLARPGPWVVFVYFKPKVWLWLPGFLTEVLLPLVLWKFVIFPLPWCLLGRAAYINALQCTLLGEVFANLYSFIIIAPNHAGDDLWRFDTPCKPYSGEFYRRAVVSSANFHAGTEWLDFFQGYLNYQIEHHCFPTLSAMSYRRAAPRVKALCAKHGIPYIQQNVFKRVLKTVDIMTGATTMLKEERKEEKEEGK